MNVRYVIKNMKQRENCKNITLRCINTNFNAIIKIFTQKCDLQSNERIHTGEKPYQCNYCDKKCARNANLKSHIDYRHNKEKPYQCEKCKKLFVTNHDLKRHWTTHTVTNVTKNLVKTAIETDTYDTKK